MKEVTFVYCPLCREAIDVTMDLTVTAEGMETNARNIQTRITVKGAGMSTHTCKRGPQDAQ